MTTAAPSPRGQLPPAGTYLVDPARSVVAVTTRHLFGLAGVKATFAVREGTLVIADPLSASTAAAVLDAGSFTSGNKKRDQDVSSAKYLDAASHPDIAFASNALQQDGDRWILRGTVIAHGTPAPAELTVTEIAFDGTDLALHGATSIDRYAHGVVAGKGMAGRHLAIELHVVARPSSVA